MRATTIDTALAANFEGNRKEFSVEMETLALILGGGQGQRLYPLTKMRSKPAVPLGGKYRLIDITVSNCINSGITQIYVLTQFNSASLNRHLSRTYRFSPFSDGFVDILAAEQTPDNRDWFQGTADGQQVMMHIRELKPERSHPFRRSPLSHGLQEADRGSRQEQS
jgi:ADP-glucose pyrophosphorylase